MKYTIKIRCVKTVFGFVFGFDICRETPSLFSGRVLRMYSDMPSVWHEKVGNMSDTHTHTQHNRLDFVIQIQFYGFRLTELFKFKR